MVFRVFVKRCMLIKFVVWIISDYYNGILVSDYLVKYNGYFLD